MQIHRKIKYTDKVIIEKKMEMQDVTEKVKKVVTKMKMVMVPTTTMEERIERVKEYKMVPKEQDVTSI